MLKVSQQVAVSQASFLRREQRDRDEVMSPTTCHCLKNVLRKLLCLHFNERGLRLSIWLFTALYVTHSKLLMLKREKKYLLLIQVFKFHLKYIYTFYMLASKTKTFCRPFLCLFLTRMH